MIKANLTFSDFCSYFNRAGCGDQFSCKAMEWLYDFLEENNPDYDLKVIELCCDYVEMDYEELKDQYEINDIEELNDKTVLIGFDDDTVLFQRF
jgi:hypothetical protein